MSDTLYYGVTKETYFFVGPPTSPGTFGRIFPTGTLVFWTDEELRARDVVWSFDAPAYWLVISRYILFDHVRQITPLELLAREAAC